MPHKVFCTYCSYHKDEWVRPEHLQKAMVIRISVMAEQKKTSVFLLMLSRTEEHYGNTRHETRCFIILPSKSMTVTRFCEGGDEIFGYS
jgi:hypothetical protein